MSQENQELINLTKKVEAVLDLRKIAGVQAQVCLAIDGSGSMSGLYRNGAVQRTVNRVSAVAVKFDDNQTLDVLVFSDGVAEAEGATPSMFGTYVQKELLDKRLVEFGGTSFTPFITKVVENYFSSTVSNGIRKILDTVEVAREGLIGGLKDMFFGKKTKQVERTVSTSSTTTSDMSTSGYPIFVIAITDGENWDQDATRRMLDQLQNKNIFWQFVGIGNENFGFLKELKKDLPNVDFFPADDLDNVKDMELYKQLLSDKFANWVKQF